MTRLPSPEHRTGDGDSSEDEECITLSTPVDTPASNLEEVQSTMTEPDTDLSGDIQTLPDQSTTEHEPSEHEPEQDSESESDSDSSVPVIQGGVLEAPRAYLQCAMGRCRKKHHYIRPR